MLQTHKTNHKPFYKSKLIWLIPSPLLAIPALIYPGISIYGAYVFNQVPDRVSSFATTPASFGLAYQEVSFPSAAKDHLTLRGWWIPNPASKQALIIVHGKAANRAERIVLSKPFWDMGYNLLFFDLRGHGTSEGNHYYFGQYESWDTVGAFNFVKSQGFTSENIGLFGTSMGAATSLLAMGHCDEIQTAFSDSSFANFADVATERLPVEKGLPSFFMPGIFTAGRIFMDFNVAEIRPEVVLGELHHKHIFLMHGGADSVIPVSHFYRLKAAGGDNIVGTWVVPETDHTQSYDLYPQKYLQTVETFFKTYLGH
jgi:dipeptidyl aminopeptidase/acylaminoacyl peptidase